MEPWGEGLTPLVRSFRASSNGGDGRQRFPRSPGFLMAGHCQLRLPGGSGGWTERALQTQPGIFPGMAGRCQGDLRGGACVCVPACMCVMTEGLWVWTTSTCLWHECECQFIQNHTLKKMMTRFIQDSLLLSSLTMHTPLLWRLRPAPVPQGGTKQRGPLGISGLLGC